MAKVIFTLTATRIIVVENGCVVHDRVGEWNLRAIDPNEEDSPYCVPQDIVWEAARLIGVDLKRRILDEDKF
jgi:hypothetical protein